MSELRETFLDELADLYDAEQQITKGLPKMEEAAESEELKEAFRTHLDETEEQIKRLQQKDEYEKRADLWVIKGECHMHLDDVVERADRFHNELIIFSHFSTRYHPQEIRRFIDGKLPANLVERVKLWL